MLLEELFENVHSIGFRHSAAMNLLGLIVLA